MKKAVLLGCVLFGFISGGISQDILGGEVSYTHLEGSIYSITVNLYTRTSIGIDHNELLFQTGDGSPENTITGSAEILENDITEWHYTFEQTFPGPGAYYLNAVDSNRVAEIVNISDSQMEGIVAIAHLDINPLSGVNSSPQFIQKQTEVQLTNDMLVHDAIAVDPDGDELVYSLVPASASNYTFPPGATIDAATGLFQMPYAEGLYTINIKVEEFRNGQVIGVSYREMTIDGTLVSSGDDITNQFLVQAFPNPVVNQLMLSSPTLIRDVLIFDTTGRRVYTEGSVLSNQISLDFSAFQSGVYFVRMTSQQGAVEVLSVVKE